MQKRFGVSLSADFAPTRPIVLLLFSLVFVVINFEIALNGEVKIKHLAWKNPRNNGKAND